MRSDTGKPSRQVSPEGEKHGKRLWAKYTLCNTCTKKLVELACQRRPLFRLFREPLALGMRFLAWWHHVDPRAGVLRLHALPQDRFERTLGALPLAERTRQPRL
jgi:hypothetical protein